MQNVVIRDTNYYNKSSGDYEGSRYVTKNKSSIHYLFNRRREIATSIFKDLNLSLKPKNILEVACADGVMSKVISECFSASRIIANDIAKDMVEVAKKRNLKNVEFYERGNEPDLKYDLIIYLGVYNTMETDKELTYVSNVLNEGGKFVISFTHGGAWSYFFKGANHKGAHIRSIAEYESTFTRYFRIEKKYYHSLFIPHLWKMPFAEKLQRGVDFLFSLISQKPFHENIYVLVKK